MGLDQYGWDPYYNPSLGNTKVEVLKGPCRIADQNVSAPGAAAMTWWLLYDALAANVTVGTTVPTLAIPIPDGGILDAERAKPVQFSNGLTMAASSSASGSGAPAANLVVNFALAGDGYSGQ